MDVNSAVELNDSEILTIERGPLAWMQHHQGRDVPLESFRQECQHRFAEAGFAVDVKTFETDQPGLYGFNVEIVGRTHYGTPFDPDQQVWEVQHDILELPGKQAGAIKTDKGAVRALLDGNRDAGKHLH